jgi:cytidyltransferase-like protein
MKNIVLVSGGFDPIHSGHIKLIQDASNYGDVIVLLNSDNWLRNKKGKEFLSFYERDIILNSIKNVIKVISFDDSDKTCIDGIKKIINKYPNQKIIFANGGDRNNSTTPELEFCQQNNIKTIWGIGGEDKANSSSWILKKWNET